MSKDDTPDDTPNNVINLDEERKKREPSEFEQTVSENISGAWKEIVREGLDEEGNPTIDINADLLKEHGAAMFASLAQSVLSAVPTDDMKVSIPTGVKTSDDDKGEEVTLNLDLGALLTKITTPKSED
jgi:hypothetical protein